MKTLHIIDRGSTCVVRGNAWPILTALGIRPIYCDGGVRGFVVDRRHLADLCAYLDHRRTPYQLHKGEDA